VQPEPDLADNYAVYFADLVNRELPWQHDSNKLAQAIMDLYYEKTGPLLSKEESGLKSGL
jgi:hypothetical protein